MHWYLIIDHGVWSYFGSWKHLLIVSFKYLVCNMKYLVIIVAWYTKSLSSVSSIQRCVKKTYNWTYKLYNSEHIYEELLMRRYFTQHTIKLSFSKILNRGRTVICLKAFAHALTWCLKRSNSEQKVQCLKGHFWSICTASEIYSKILSVHV